MGQLGMGSANFMEMQQRMQRDLMSNPDMLRQVNRHLLPTRKTKEIHNYWFTLGSQGIILFPMFSLAVGPRQGYLFYQPFKS